MLSFMKMRFANLCPDKHLKVYGVPEDKLNKYKASKTNGNAGYVYDVKPSSKFRLKDEEILT